MLAFIIFGTRGIRSTISQGDFYCPQCDCDSPYKHKKVTQFFTLYFIPLIPLGNKGQYIECQSCRNTYIERILDMRPEIDITDRPAPKRRVAAPAQQIDSPKEVSTAPRTLAEKLAEQETQIAAETNAVQQSDDILPEKHKVIKKILIMMILADGKVEDSEIHMFHKVYRQMTGGVVSDIYSEIEEVRTENKPAYQYLKKMSAYLNDEGKRDIIKSSMMIAASDGDIDPTEVSMVQNFGKALEMKPAEVKEIMNTIK